LVALDRFGDLWIFELKAITGASENLLQALRYSQIYGLYTIDDLDRVYRRHNPNQSSLVSEFCQNYGYTTRDAIVEWTAKIGKKHHLVVVTNGTDEDTLSAIAHWQSQGMDIRAWLYEVYPGSDSCFHLEVPQLYHRGVRISTSKNQVFLVNTDRKHGNETENYMLQRCRAVATSPGWMEQIDRITNGSKVLLYANGIGIIAGGIATAERKDDVVGSEAARYVQLVEFFKVDPPLTQKDVQSLFNWTQPVLRTITVLSNTDNIAEKVWKKALERRLK
jgi:hypothetical protein